MQPEEQGLSTSALIALASEQLGSSGYQVVRDVNLPAFPRDRALLAEDEYTVVAIIAYNTWNQLQADWQEAQGELVSLLSRQLARSSPKAFDAYLVLLCTGFAADGEAVSQIERDTTRVRKIVATADTLKTTADLAHILDIFMPITAPKDSEAITDVLDLLPSLMAEDVPPRAAKAVVDAFRALEPPLERLHALDRRT